MNIEEFREYCLSFKGVHEKMPFPNEDVSDDKIKELVSKSYDIVVKSLTKKERVSV